MIPRQSLAQACVLFTLVTSLLAAKESNPTVQMLDGLAAVAQPSPPTPGDYSFPRLGQTGRSYVIGGPFDGHPGNTRIEVGGMRVPVIAESKRDATIEIPSPLVGPTNINVAENGKTASGSFRAVKIYLTAPKTSLMRGESTELRVEVHGLTGITGPVPIQIQNRTPQNISLSGGNTQNIVVQPSQVSSDGIFTWSAAVTGTSAGPFAVAGSLAPADSTGPVITSSPNPTSTPSQAAATPLPSPPINTVTTKPDVQPATEQQKFYAGFADEDSDCCKRLIKNGVLNFQDGKGNSFTIDRDKLKMTVDGQTYEWQFTQDGKPVWIEWMFCHLKDDQVVSQLTSVMATRLVGGKTTESGGGTSISMVGPSRDEKTTRPYYGLQFSSLKIGTDNKQYAVSFSLDEETCKWSFQLFAEEKTASGSNGPPGSPSQILNYLSNNQDLRLSNAWSQGSWWSHMYRIAGELQNWNAWLAQHPNADAAGRLRDAYGLWSAMVKNALNNLEGSAGAAEKQLFDQMRALLASPNPTPAVMSQVFWKFNDLWLRFREGLPQK